MANKDEVLKRYIDSPDKGFVYLKRSSKGVLNDTKSKVSHGTAVIVSPSSNGYSRVIRCYKYNEEWMVCLSPVYIQDKYLSIEKLGNLYAVTSKPMTLFDKRSDTSKVVCNICKGTPIKSNKQIGSWCYIPKQKGVTAPGWTKSINI